MFKNTYLYNFGAHMTSWRNIFTGSTVAHDARTHLDHVLSLHHVVEHHLLVGRPGPRLKRDSVLRQQVRIGILAMLISVKVLHTSKTVGPINLWRADHSPKFHQDFSCTTVILEDVCI